MAGEGLIDFSLQMTEGRIGETPVVILTKGDTVRELDPESTMPWLQTAAKELGIETLLAINLFDNHGQIIWPGDW